ncbi:MAG: CoA transferase [Chloroflexota bacterium]|nr:CoA transferase [Chloroflexota bacterium]
MHQPLEGIRVLEWGTFHAGPGANAILAEMGAEVIKIEQPGVGDPMRHQARFGHASFELPGGRSLFNEASNRSKKGITVNLTQEQGREIAYRLVSRSDVFLTNFRPQVVEEMRMTYPTLLEHNPRLIYVSVSAYGSRGPDSRRGGFDFQGQARSGLMFAMGEPDMPPMVLHFGVIDQATAIMTSHAILTALLMRERFGIGQHVHTSILGTAMYLQYMNVLTALQLKRDVPKHHRSDTDPLRNYYRCQDGRWLCMAFPAHWEDRWPMLCQAMGHPELQDHPEFSTREMRLKNTTSLVTVFDDIFATRPRDEWLKAFAEIDLIACPVNSALELESDPQVMENEYIIDFDDPDYGTVRLPGYPVHFSETSVRTKSIAPALGEHNEEVLSGIGGYSAEEIARFRREAVI